MSAEHANDNRPLGLCIDCAAYLASIQTSGNRGEYRASGNKGKPARAVMVEIGGIVIRYRSMTEAAKTIDDSPKAIWQNLMRKDVHIRKDGIRYWYADARATA